MKQTEKEIVLSLTEAMLALPPEKREFMLGYAEGVAAMSQRAEQPHPQPRESAR